MDRVAVDFANVEVVVDFLGVRRRDVVCGSPDFWRVGFVCRVLCKQYISSIDVVFDLVVVYTYRIVECLPESTLNHGNHAAWRFDSAPMVGTIMFSQ